MSIIAAMTHPLKVWRDGLKLSQPEAAERLGVDAMTVSRWERGEHLPRRDQWSVIAITTGVSIAELVQHLKSAESAQ